MMFNFNSLERNEEYSAGNAIKEKKEKKGSRKKMVVVYQSRPNIKKERNNNNERGGKRHKMCSGAVVLWWWWTRVDDVQLKKWPTIIKFKCENSRNQVPSLHLQYSSLSVLILLASLVLVPPAVGNRSGGHVARSTGGCLVGVAVRLPFILFFDPLLANVLLQDKNSIKFKNKRLSPAIFF